MNITHYLVDFGYSTALKNNLQKEAYEYLKSLDGKLIESSHLADFIKSILVEVDHLNAKYHRCKPLHVKLSALCSDKDLILWGFPEVSFKLKAAELCNVSQFQRVVSPSNN